MNAFTSLRRALVTGGTGFVGWHLIRRLNAQGCDVHAIVRADSKASELRSQLGDQNVHAHDGTMAGMQAIVEAARPEVVFHLASLFLAQHTTADVTRLVKSNVEFPAQLAEAMAVAKTPFLVNTGTAWQHFENADFNPVNLYAATKQAYVDILRYYTGMGAFRAVNLELYDTFGPGDTRPKLFAVLRKAAASGEKLAMSPGDQLIDLMYIDDVVDAFMAAAKRLCTIPDRMETFAVSSGAPLKLRALVELWQSVTGNKLAIEWGGRPYRPREVMIPWNRGATIPGWAPQVTIAEGIRRMES